MDVFSNLLWGRKNVESTLMERVRVGRRKRMGWDKEGGAERFFVGCLTFQEHAVYLRDGSAQTILHAATLR